MRVVPTLDKSKWSLWRMEQAEYSAGEPTNVVYGHLDRYDTPPEDWDMSETHSITPLSRIASKGKNYVADHDSTQSTRKPRLKKEKSESQYNYEPIFNSYIEGFKSDDDERKEEELKARREKYLVEW